MIYRTVLLPVTLIDLQVLLQLPGTSPGPVFRNVHMRITYSVTTNEKSHA